jgi:hypothetical protein
LVEVLLPTDCEPEDMDEQEAVIAGIKTSGYLGFHSEFDAVAAVAEKRLIYDRTHQS